MKENSKEDAPGAGTATGGAEGHAVHHHNHMPRSIGDGGGAGERFPLTGNTGAALDFLERWRPGGPWVLTSIVPDGRTNTQTFDAGTVEEMREWIDARQNRENIYFTVNDAGRALSKKAKKTDIAAARALHVDVDPRPGEELSDERERALRMLRAYDPPPTVILDSGGGYQGFWLFEEPVPLSGEPEDDKRHLPVERRNLQLEVLLSGDSCHNIDRIMRLPGTVNVPTEKKRKKGREPALARVVEADWSRRHRMGDFPEAPDPASGGGAAPAAVTATPARGVSLDELPDAVSDRCRQVIALGNDPDDTTRFGSRSEAVFHVACELIRADVPDEMILGILLDPDLAISEHVRERGKADPAGYARRQLERALEKQPRPGPVVVPVPMNLARACRDALRPNLRHHMQEFVYWDGAAYVALADETVRAEVWRFLETCRVQAEKEIKALVPKSEMVTGSVDALKAVTHLPHSREEPPRWLDGRDGPDPLELLPTRSGLLHLSTGDLLPATPELFTRNALDFSHDPNAPEPERWLSFLRDVWPGDDEADCVTALQEFMGYLLTPDTRLQKALLITGPKRSGKGTIGHIMGKLVGEANTTAPTLNSLGRSGGDFALEPLLAKQLAIVSDARLSRRTDEAAVAENLLRITGEDRVSVNRKHRKAVEVTLRTRFVVMTNELPRFADRSGALVSRFIVLPMRQSFYGREDTGLKGALISELPGILNWAVEGWRRVRAGGRITQPEAGSEMAMQMTDLSSPIPAFIRECCELGVERWVPKDRLFRAFREWHRNRMGQDYTGKSNAFAADLYTATNCAVRDYKRREGGERVPSFAGVALRSSFDLTMEGDEMPF